MEIRSRACAPLAIYIYIYNRFSTTELVHFAARAYRNSLGIGVFCIHDCKIPGFFVCTEWDTAFEKGDLETRAIRALNFFFSLDLEDVYVWASANGELRKWKSSFLFFFACDRLYELEGCSNSRLGYFFFLKDDVADLRSCVISLSGLCILSNPKVG